jgi:RHS repeat-associated protein
MRLAAFVRKKVVTTTYAYDNDGNLTSAGTGTATTTYVYDYSNRLIALLLNGATSTTYGYDAFGARVYQIASTTATSTYPFKFFSIASTTRGSTNFATSTEYVFNGDMLLATVDQAFKNGTATGTARTRYVHPDHLGSTNVVTDENGNLVQTLDYYPYGGTRVSVSTSTNEKRKWIGQFRDDSGLDYLNARYYDSSRGQFISEDPVFWEIGLTPDGKKALANLQYVNSYAYSSDNPISSKDPSGRIAGVDDAISFGVGGVVNTSIYAGSSLWSGQPITRSGMAGAFTAGGIMGVAIDNAPETGGTSIAAGLAAIKYASKWGAIAAPAGNAVTQGWNVLDGLQPEGINWTELGFSPIQGGASAALGEGVFSSAKIPLLSAGRGSWSAVGKWARTSTKNGTIQNISISTAFKSAAGSQAANSYKTAGSAVWDVSSARMGNAVSTWMGAFNPFMPQAPQK